MIPVELNRGPELALSPSLRSTFMRKGNHEQCFSLPDIVAHLLLRAPRGVLLPRTTASILQARKGCDSGQGPAVLLRLRCLTLRSFSEIM